MSRHNDKLDSLFKKMADSYAEQYGNELKQEFDELERNTPPMITPGLDAKVKEKLKPRRKNYGRIMGLIAACALVAVIIPVIYNTVGSPPLNTATIQEATDAVAEEVLPEDAAGEAAIAEEAAPPAMADDAPAMEEPAAEEAAAEEAEDSVTSSAPEQQYEIIPLSFDLPENFTVEDVEQDIGKTIYYLQDMRLDDTVLTLERSDGFTVPDGLTEYEINGQAAYGSYEPDYSYLTFEKGGIVYEMTCEHDLNTLLELGAAIL
ncbi:hypothetical protein LJC56_05285 [Christensenellaceae bacterium OttesenSCG-928-K19]|nr:hypothetical protein [Christensenellaceae bacterium OttesenSCG-928-K19]